MSESTEGASPILLLEHWKPVVGFEGYYEVSNVGNVCRIKKYKGNKPYKHKRPWIGKGTGYKMVDLCKNNVNRKFTVHGLVARAFISNRDALPTINHANGYKPKNWVSNLEYMTVGDNVRHAYRLGLNPIGEDHTSAKLTERQALEILALKGVIGCTYVGRRYGISATAVLYIWSGRNWGHLQKAASVPPLDGDQFRLAI